MTTPSPPPPVLDRVIVVAFALAVAVRPTVSGTMEENPWGMRVVSTGPGGDCSDSDVEAGWGAGSGLGAGSEAGEADGAGAGSCDWDDDETGVEDEVDWSLVIGGKSVAVAYPPGIVAEAEVGVLDPPAWEEVAEEVAEAVPPLVSDDGEKVLMVPKEGSGIEGIVRSSAAR
jgi:hypothetical protein